MYGNSLHNPKQKLYMPYKGEIVGAAINLAIPPSAGPMKFYVANYSASYPAAELIGFTYPPPTNCLELRSLYYNITGESGQSRGLHSRRIVARQLFLLKMEII